VRSSNSPKLEKDENLVGDDPDFQSRHARFLPSKNTKLHAMMVTTNPILSVSLKNSVISATFDLPTEQAK
jgi:hypothetical protein